MADPRFYDNAGPFALGVLAAKIGGRLADGADANRLVHDVASLASAAAGMLCYALAPKNLIPYGDGLPGLAIMPAALAATLPEGSAAILHDNPHAAFAQAASLFYPAAGFAIGPRDGNFIDPTARLGAGVILEPGVAIGPGSEVGAGTHIAANAVIGRGVQIGRNCLIGPNVSVIYALIGDGVRLHPGARIGADGFSYVPAGAGLLKVPQLGRVILQDGVEIGANSCVDRGALDDTVLGEGTKLDNLVQIGHNCRIGRHSIIVSQTGLSGSVTLGDFVVVGGQSAFSDHITIGSNARFAARSAVIRDLPGGQDYGGAPAQPIAAWRRELMAVRRLGKGKKRADG